MVYSVLRALVLTNTGEWPVLTGVPSKSINGSFLLLLSSSLSLSAFVTLALSIAVLPRYL